MSLIIEIQNYFTFREIFHKISTNTGDFIISNVNINENDISYDLISEENQVSITMFLQGDTIMYPYIDSLIVSMEYKDEILLRNLKRMWEL